MNKPLVFGLVAGLCALDWAALHDIVKGEPDVTLEWAVVSASAFVFGVLVGRRGR